VWIVYAWYIDGWWSHEVVPGDFNCTSEELTKILNNSIALQVHAVTAHPNVTTDAGIVSRSYKTIEFLLLIHFYRPKFSFGSNIARN